jgi:hypothetical protein
MPKLNSKFYNSWVRYVPGRGKQTERFIHSGSEGTEFSYTSCKSVNYFFGDNLISYGNW